MDAAPASHQGPLPPAPNVQPLRGVLTGFAIDVAIAFLVGAGLMLAASLALGMVSGISAAVQGADSSAVRDAMASPGASAAIAMVLVASATTALLLYSWRRPATVTERRYSHEQLRRARTWGLAAATGLLMFVATSLASWILQRVGLPPSPTNLAPIRAALAEHPGFIVFFTVVAAPLYEELLFRRVLFGRFWQAGRPVLGMWLSGAVFALSHEIPGTGSGPIAATLCLFLVYAAMGAAFAWLYRRTATLWAPILAHALNNGLALAFLFISGS
jgi:membrane protease YdiL (CAAX protease family)